MFLAIDVGNTNTVFALFDQAKLIQSWRMRTEPDRSKDEYAIFLGRLFELNSYKLSDVSDVYISSVVPETRFSLERFCSSYLDLEPVYVTKDVIDIEIDLLRPEDVGADRLLNAIAVKNEYDQVPAIVIDFGTATTFDVVDSKGRYAGGVIAPGINLSLNALHSAASKLPKVNIEHIEKATGKTTTEAMKAGLYWGYKGLIEGVLNQLIKELEVDEKPLVLATGGLAPLYAENIDLIDKVDADLTLKGLYQIYEKQKV